METASTHPDNLNGPLGLSKDRAEVVAKMLGCSGSHELPGGGYAPCQSSDQLNTLVRRGVAGIRKPTATHMVTRHFTRQGPTPVKDVFSAMPTDAPSDFGRIQRDGIVVPPRRKRRLLRRVRMVSSY